MLGMPTRIRRAAVLLASCALVVSACGGDDDDSAGGDEATDTPAAEDVQLPESYVDYHSDVYQDDAHWLCKPGLEDDVCSRDLDATVVNADGTTEVQAFEPAQDPPIDCFYVYPTVSYDESPNSDFEAGEGEEITAVLNQAARLGSVCRVFAPIYRQATLSTIGGSVPEGVNPFQVAHDDVIDAFRDYVANESDGRPFVLIGHSQGAAHLNSLIAEEIDDEPLLRDRLVAAYLLGWTVNVPEGQVVGGDFDNVPLCEAEDQTGCVVSYSSFRSTAPPPANSFFARSDDAGDAAGCVNPASPGGGAATLHPYFPVDVPDGGLIGGSSATTPFADAARTSEITTPFMTFPDFVRGECVHDGAFTYLSLTVEGEPADPRTDDIGGDLSPEWGMHLIDANVAMGDIVDLVSAQADAYPDRSR
jgi:Protein of unknown function (DUF3089)